MLEWLSNNNMLSGWAQALASVITGALAIYAALKAFNGAKLQADAVWKVHEEQIKFNTRTIACGIFAELLNNYARLRINADRMHRFSESGAANFFDVSNALLRIDISFMASVFNQFGVLPINTVLPTMSIYKELSMIMSDIEDIKSMSKSFIQDYQHDRKYPVVNTKILEEAYIKVAFLMEGAIKDMAPVAGDSVEAVNSRMQQINSELESRSKNYAQA